MSKLTILEKIKNLTWFNLVELLQDILPNFNKRIEYLEDKSENTKIIGEAPINGNQYGRQNGAWTEITGGDSQNFDQTLNVGNTTNKDFYYEDIKSDGGIIQDIKVGVFKYNFPPAGVNDLPFVGLKLDFSGTLTDYSHLGFNSGIGAGATILKSTNMSGVIKDTIFNLPDDIDTLGNPFATATLAVRTDIPKMSGGTYTFTGDGSATFFDIPHTLTGTIKTHFVTRSSDSTGSLFGSVVVGNVIRVTFIAGAPPNGTNIIVNWGAFN